MNELCSIVWVNKESLEPVITRVSDCLIDTLTGCLSVWLVVWVCDWLNVFYMSERLSNYVNRCVWDYLSQWLIEIVLVNDLVNGTLGFWIFWYSRLVEGHYIYRIPARKVTQLKKKKNKNKGRQLEVYFLNVCNKYSHYGWW